MDTFGRSSQYERQCGDPAFTSKTVPVLSPATPLVEAMRREAAMFDIWLIESTINRTPTTQKEA